MKKFLAVLTQVVLFFLVFGVFSFLQPFHIHWFQSHPTPTVTRYFVADGFLLATGLLLVLLLVELAARRMRNAVPLTLLSYVLSIAGGLLIKFGWYTHDLLG